MKDPRIDEIKALMQQRGMSQSALARSVGIDQGQIWRLLNGPPTVRDRNIELLLAQLRGSKASISR